MKLFRLFELFGDAGYLFTIVCRPPMGPIGTIAWLKRLPVM